MTAWRLRTGNPDARALFPSLDSLGNLTGTEINRNWMSRLLKVEQAGAAYYVKTYASRGRGLRAIAGRSRARAEWENLLVFRALGVPTANLVAHGEGRVEGRYRGAVITEGIAASHDLASIASASDNRLDDPAWVRKVSAQLADAVRKLHEADFVHADLKWRNVLVTDGPEPKVYLIDCPQGRRMSGLRLRRGIVKDLACLDKVAQRALSKSRRLGFYLAYKRKAKLAAADKREVARVARFFPGHGQR